MTTVLLAAFLLGIVAGLRTFTAPAVLLWFRDRGGLWAILLTVAALVEYAGDVYPKTPPRTGALGLPIRLISGGFCGWQLALAGGVSPALGAAIGVVGAVAGAFGGLHARMRLIDRIGLVPSGILEDAVAVVVAILVCMHP